MKKEEAVSAEKYKKALAEIKELLKENQELETRIQRQIILLGKEKEAQEMDQWKQRAIMFERLIRIIKATANGVLFEGEDDPNPVEKFQM